MRGIRVSGIEAMVASVPGSETTLHFIGPTLFVGLLVAAAILVPVVASGVRRGLPDRRRGALLLEPVCFGSSQKARRSPRHAVLLHRGLVGSFFMALVALLLVPAAASLSVLGVAAIPTAMAFVIPTLLVTLHARRRSSRE
jgi:hypothetical protein